MLMYSCTSERIEMSSLHRLLTKQSYCVQVLKRLPNLKKLDGAPVESEERDAAIAAVAASIPGGQ